MSCGSPAKRARVSGSSRSPGSGTDPMRAQQSWRCARMGQCVQAVAPAQQPHHAQGHVATADDQESSHPVILVELGAAAGRLVAQTVRCERLSHVLSGHHQAKQPHVHRRGGRSRPRSGHAQRHHPAVRLPQRRLRRLQRQSPRRASGLWSVRRPHPSRVREEARLRAVLPGQAAHRPRDRSARDQRGRRDPDQEAALPGAEDRASVARRCGRCT